MNKFLDKIDEILLETEEQMIMEIEDLDELDEVIDIENYSIREIILMSINPLFDIQTSCKKGLKSPDWISISKNLSEIEKRMISDELNKVGGCY